jgi:adenylate cyclase
MNIEDAYSHPLFNPDVDRRTGYRTRNSLTCAITDSSGKPTAVLQALNKRGMGAKFTQEDEQQLRLVSWYNHAAT